MIKDEMRIEEEIWQPAAHMIHSDNVTWVEVGDHKTNVEKFARYVGQRIAEFETVSLTGTGKDYLQLTFTAGGRNRRRVHLFAKQEILSSFLEEISGLYAQ